MDRVVKILDSVLKQDFIELSFSDICVYRPDDQKIKIFQDKIETFFNSQTTESKEANLLMYITKCEKANPTQLKLFYDTLDYLVRQNVLGPRVICEQVRDLLAVPTSHIYNLNIFPCSCFLMKS